MRMSRGSSKESKRPDHFASLPGIRKRVGRYLLMALTLLLGHGRRLHRKEEESSVRSGRVSICGCIAFHSTLCRNGALR